MSLDEGDLDYIDLVRFLSSKENILKYGGKWVGVLGNYGKRQIVVTAPTSEDAARQVRLDYGKELRSGYSFSTARVPLPGGKLELGIFAEGIR